MLARCRNAQKTRPWIVDPTLLLLLPVEELMDAEETWQF
jgi:hypothetical protein